jgi:type I restriction enzyme S subunit
MSNQNNNIPEGFKMTELGPLPEEWEIIPFINSVGRRAGNIPDSIQRAEYKPIGKYPIIDQSEKYVAGYTDEAARLYSSGVPVIIFGDHTRVFKFVDFPFALGADGTKILRPNQDLFDPKYLYYYLVSLDIPSRGYNRHFKLLKEKIVVKPPLPEQKAIARVLSTIQNAIEAQDKVIAAARELKKSLMRHLFTYGPVPVAEAEKVPLKETEIGPVPEHWEVARLADVAEHLIGGGTPSTNHPEYWDGPIHWTTSRRINGIHLSSGERGITQRGLEESSTHLIPKNNLLIGTRVGVGKVAINDIDIAISQDLTGMFVDKDKYELEFLAYQITTPGVQTQFIDYMRGTTIKGIPRQDLKRISLEIPPLPEQREIAKAIAVWDKKIETEEKRKATLQTLFKTMLHLLMTGKVRVEDLEAQVV